MKTSKLRNIAWVAFALVLTTTTVFAQGRRSENGYSNSQNCINNISDLTEIQKEQIQKMNAEHQQEMAELRAQRRSTTAVDKKNEIREQMLQKNNAHRNAVKNVLTPEQQNEYNQLPGNRNFRQNKNSAKGQGSYSSCVNQGNRMYATNNAQGKRGNSNACRKGAGNRQNKGVGGGRS